MAFTMMRAKPHPSAADAATPSQTTGRPWLGGLLAVLLCVRPSPAVALDVETLAGYGSDFGRSSFTYAGVGVVEPMTDRLALRARVVFSYLTYEFREGGQTVEAQAPGVTGLVGLRYHLTPEMSLSLFGGGEVRRTDLDRGRSETRNDDGAAAQAEWHYAFSPKADLLVLYSYKSADDFHWGRVAVRREILTLGSEDTFALGIGLEGIGMGNQDFRAVQGGPLLEIRHRPTGGSLLLGVGPKYFDAEGITETRPYFSVGLYISF